MADLVEVCYTIHIIVTLYVHRYSIHIHCKRVHICMFEHTHSVDTVYSNCLCMHWIPALVLSACTRTRLTVAKGRTPTVQVFQVSVLPWIPTRPGCCSEQLESTLDCCSEHFLVLWFVVGAHVPSLLLVMCRVPLKCYSL